jgi:hypothetical protein
MTVKNANALTQSVRKVPRNAHIHNDKLFVKINVLLYEQ